MVSLSHMVHMTLRQTPDARDDDRLLCQLIWTGYFPECYTIDVLGNKAMKLDAPFVLPCQAEIKRERRHLQNTLGRFQATDPKVKKARGQKEQRMRKKYARVF